MSCKAPRCPISRDTGRNRSGCSAPGRPAWWPPCIRFPPRRALDQPQFHRVEPFPGKRGAELAQRVFLRDDPHEGVVPVTVDEVVEDGGAVALEPEHRVQAARDHGVQKYEREVAPIDDHDIARRQGIEMGARCGPLVGIGRQGEVDRRLGLEAVQARDTRPCG